MPLFPTHKPALALLVGAGIGLMAPAAFADVATDGCVDTATSCTLEELYDGGSILVDDVSFDAFAFIFDDSDIALDPGAIDVTGVSGDRSAAITFDFGTEALVDNENLTLIYAFDFLADILDTSSRTIVDVVIEGTIDRDGDATTEVTALERTGAFSLSIFDDAILGADLSDSAAVGMLTSLELAMNLVGEQFEDDTTNLLSSLTFQLTLDSDLPPVPLPGALPFMVAGLVGFGMLRRRKKAVA